MLRVSAPSGSRSGTFIRQQLQFIVGPIWRGSDTDCHRKVAIRGKPVKIGFLVSPSCCTWPYRSPYHSLDQAEPGTQGLAEPRRVCRWQETPLGGGAPRPRYPTRCSSSLRDCSGSYRGLGDPWGVFSISWCCADANENTPTPLVGFACHRLTTVRCGATTHIPSLDARNAPLTPLSSAAGVGYRPAGLKPAVARESSAIRRLRRTRAADRQTSRRTSTATMPDLRDSAERVPIGLLLRRLHLLRRCRA